jgi:hypothetical protein
MATKRKKDEGSTLGRLAGRGEEAMTKVVDELARNPRVTEALGRAMSAKGRVDSASRRTLGTIGLAAADELKDLRKQIERLEKRLSRLEGGKKPAPARKPTGTKRKTAKKKPSPAPGRAIGGGTGRGSGGGTTPG